MPVVPAPRPSPEPTAFCDVLELVVVVDVSVGVEQEVKTSADAAITGRMMMSFFIVDLVLSKPETVALRSSDVWVFRDCASRYAIGTSRPVLLEA